MAATASNKSPIPSLSFPRPIFAAVTPHHFLEAHLTSSKAQKPQRANGRTATESRTPEINTGSLTHCNGSAVVRLDNTVAVCGVRAELLKEENLGANETTSRAEDEDEGSDRQEIENLRLLVPNVELSTGSTPNLLPGNAPSTFAQTLVTRIRNLLLSTSLIRTHDLRILYTPSSGADDADEQPETLVKGYWVLYIDTLFISLDGNAFDAAWLAILAALRDTKLPKAYFDEELETILCSDSPSDTTRLSLRGLPVPSTFAVFEGQKQDDGDVKESLVLSDPDAFEEAMCKESVCVVVDKSKARVDLRKLEKSGGGVVDRGILRSLVKRTGDRWDEWENALSRQS